MSLVSVADALAHVLDGVAPLPVESVPVAEADGRVLAVDLTARRSQPPADLSAMDGYAVRAADVAQAPARLKIVGEVAAGRPFGQAIGPGEAARIFTGGVLPEGADTVVIQELTRREDGDVVVLRPTAPGKNVRPQGLDFREGDVCLRRGRRLTARDLALAAAMNHPNLSVYRRPRVAVLATGDELVAPGTVPRLGQIVYSNGFALTGIARREGAEVADLGIVPDRLEDTVAAIRKARSDPGPDVLVTTGGASVGDYDLVQPAFAAEGMRLSFWKVALRPGRPLMHGRLDAMQVLGLPGNPVSAYVCSVLFLVPLLRRLSGREDVVPGIESAVLGCDLPANDERADYLRATLAQGPEGIAVATPLRLQDSSLLSVLSKADCLVIRAPYAPETKAGARCDILKLER
ncbi:MAG TPA: gephyrin-like molybdotransferase Glp [Xanthobacteraceae bacterium]|nr:gephyrin-like molybdotransferase Glp [Xanthobacteraceae bacterium]